MLDKQLKNVDFSEIKMIALDLDGTTLTRAGLTRRTKDVLEQLMASGIHVVIATGRVFDALPESILKLKGLRYIVTSNGAKITSLETGTVIYSNTIENNCIEEIHGILSHQEYPVEVFTGGKAYIDRSVYDDLAQNGSTYMSPKYVLRTRKPVECIFDFLLEHRQSIENINIHFAHAEDKHKMRQALEEIEGVTITSSFIHNLEIGGATTSKATAIQEICRLEHLSMEQVIAFGDSPNDIAMLMTSGVGVAMGNGTDEVKKIADFVTLTNEEEGVDFFLRHNLLKGKQGIKTKNNSFFRKLIDLYKQDEKLENRKR